MVKVTKDMALDYHDDGHPGKIEVVPTKPYATQLDLSLAYSPGVAYPCLEIQKNPSDSFRYTDKGNLIGVISNGTAVLGLGDIGALAGKPVMEGKALLFKIFAGLDAFDIEIDETDPEKFISIVKALTPTFGGINLEDIKAPECFEIERRLKEECDIPIMHDDQHGTAIISGAGLLNALELQGKDISETRLVVNGAGAAAISCTRLYVALGIRPSNVVMCDSKGVIRVDRENLSAQKKEFATTRDIHTLEEAMVGADVFLGLSVAGVLTQEMIRTMAPNPIVFALANPDPEISYEEAREARSDVIVATGRSDYPNQINNVIGFPYIFRGALDCHAVSINEDMKIGAVHAIAELAREPVPAIVDRAYGGENIKFGPDYILPKALDPRLLLRVAPAVAKAAADSGVAMSPITDWDGYQVRLRTLMGDDGKLIRRITECVKRIPQRVVFTDGSREQVIRAAARLSMDGVCHPVLLGNQEIIERKARCLGLGIDGISVIDPRNDSQEKKRHEYARVYATLKQREGMTYEYALEEMYGNMRYAMMMTVVGDVDAMVAGVYSAGLDLIHDVASVVGIADGMSHFATMHIAHTRGGSYILADTAINPVADVTTIVDTARQVDKASRFLGIKPVMALLSYSNFGSNHDDEEPGKCAEAIRILHEKYPEIDIEGEMQLDYALDTELRDRDFPFNSIKGKKVNVLLFPSLSAANISYKLLLSMGGATINGPLQCGLAKPVYFVGSNTSERELIDVATIASLDALANKGETSGCGCMTE